MVWRRKQRPEIVFDEGARNDWLTGFKKRKDQRRKQAAIQALEWERYDRMQVQKDHREAVKRQWKEITNAERRTEKLIDKQVAEKRRKKALRGDAGESEEERDKFLANPEEDVAPAFFLRDRDAEEGSLNEAGGQETGEDGPVRKKKRRKGALVDGAVGVAESADQVVGKKKKTKKSKKAAAELGSEDAGSDADEEDPEEEGEAKEGVKTVDFDVEDDDPWGGCMVTTVEGAPRGPGGAVAQTGLNWAIAIDGREEGRELTPAEDEARRLRRRENLEKQEAIRLEAIDTKIEKMKLQAKREKKKRKEPKSNKKKRLGAKERRLRTKQAKRGPRNSAK